MATVTTRLGPADHGRLLDDDDCAVAAFEPGYRYELIDGRLYVSPEANLSEDRIDQWLYAKMLLYSQAHPEIVNYVSNKARVFVPGRPGITAPEPDLAVYRHFPLRLPFRKVHWQDVSPFLVGEVLSLDDPHKDLVRNAVLYLQVTSIREYWLFDNREAADRPNLRVHRRHGSKWRIIDLEYGDTYTTKLLPGFELLIDPRR